MRLSEEQVQQVRDTFIKLAEKQADMVCTAYESLAQQLPGASDEYVTKLFNELINEVGNAYNGILSDYSSAINEKLKDSEFLTKIKEEVEKNGGTN